MNLWENVLVALQGLAANKLRSALTMLGIIIGVLAVILGTAIGQGSKQQVVDRIQSLAATLSPYFRDRDATGRLAAARVRGKP